MKQYRIKKYDHNYSTVYKVQKRSIFGFWYRVSDSLAHSGYYTSFEGAKIFVESVRKTEIVWKSKNKNK